MPALRADAAEDLRRGKQHVAEIEQIGALAAGQLEGEQLGRLVELFLVQVGADRQHAFLGGDRPRLRHDRPRSATAAAPAARTVAASARGRHGQSPSFGVFRPSLGAAFCKQHRQLLARLAERRLVERSSGP